MEKEIKLVYKNYKLFSDKEFNLKDFNVYLVTGKNGVGKTSLVTSLQEIYGVVSLTNDPITTGSTEGSKTFTIPDKDGNMVTIKHTYDKTKAKGKFVAFDEDGTPFRKVEEIRELLGSYSRITTEQFFDKAKTPEGRRTIVDEYFIQFLTEGEIVALRKAKGLEEVHYNLRAETKKRLDATELHMLNYKPTVFEKEMMGKKLESDKLLKTLRHDRDGVALFDKNMQILNERDRNLRENLTTLETEVDTRIINAKESVVGFKKELEELEKRVFVTKACIKNTEEFLQDPNKEYKDKIDGFKKQELENDKAIALEKEKAGNPDITLADLDKRIAAGDKLISEIAICESRMKDYKRAKGEFEDTGTEWQSHDEKVHGYRRDIRDIYTSSSLPDGVQIENDTFTLNGFEFSAEQISESKAKLVIAEIMCQVDTSPLLVMGNAASFGKERLNELCGLAEKYNKIMFLEKVVDEIEDVRVVGIVYNKDVSEDESK